MNTLSFPTVIETTEQLLLDTGFHPTTARAFRDFDVEAVRAELHTQDLLSWQPQEERNRRIGRLVLPMSGGRGRRWCGSERWEAAIRNQ